MTPLLPQNVRNILCLGCHADDIEIGCGATILRLLREHPQAHVHWEVLAVDGKRRREAVDSANQLLTAAGSKEVVVAGFRDRYFPAQWEEIKDHIHRVATLVEPDIIFTHRRADLHQDHRTVAELTWNAFRNHLILEYEIPKYEGDLGQPNLYVPVANKDATKKVDTVFDIFTSQHDKPWFTKETFASLLRLRGIECNSPSGYAEGFYCRKMVM